MKKAIKHIISLFILLFFSNGLFFAHTFSHPFPKTVLQEYFSKIGYDYSSNNQFLVSNPVKEVFKKKELFSDNEEEDSENMSSKKNLEKKSCFVSFFNQKTSQFEFYHFKDSLNFYKDSFIFSNSKALYLLFEVFRI